MDIVLLSEGTKFESFFVDLCDNLVRRGVQVRYVSLGAEPPHNLSLRSVPHDEISGTVNQVKFLKDLRADVVLTSITSLGHPRFPRSPFVTHYSHIVHSLNSPLTSYRKGSFDGFDSIHSASRKMTEEFIVLKKTRGLNFQILESGYTRLSFLIKCFEELLSQSSNVENKLEITVAPTWGRGTIFEERSMPLLTQLAEISDLLFLRPHPMSVGSRRWKKLRDRLEREFPSVRTIDDTSEVETLLSSDLLLTDWSGTAMEYALTTSKSVVYVDLPQKAKQRSTSKSRSKAIERQFRDEVGVVWDLDKRIEDGEIHHLSRAKSLPLDSWKSDIYHLEDAAEHIASSIFNI